MPRCFDCKFCGMDMDMDPYCAHPKVIEHNPYGSNTNFVRGSSGFSEEHMQKPHYNLCGQEATLFEARKAS